MLKITVSFVTDDATDEDSARRFVETNVRERVASDWTASRSIRDITYVSAEVPPRTATVTVADLVAAGVAQATAESIVNG